MIKNIQKDCKKIDNENIKNKELSQIASEIYELEEQIANERKKKFVITISVIIILLCIFKIFIGQINISFPNVINQHKNRLYSVYLNNEKISIGIEENKNLISIPYIFKYSIFSSHNYAGDIDYAQMKYKIGEKLIIKIESFDCFSENFEYKITCVGNNSGKNMEMATNIKYQMLIRKTKKGEEVVYDGVFVNQIEKYLSDKGTYSVFINATYENVESIIYFNIKIE